MCKKCFGVILPYNVNKSSAQDGVNPSSFLEGSKFSHTIFSKSVSFFEQLTLTGSQLQSWVEQTEIPVVMFA